MRDAVGLSLDQVRGEVLGTAARVVLAKEMSTIVGDGSTQDAVNKRVAQIKTLLEVFLGQLFYAFAVESLICCHLSWFLII